MGIRSFIANFGTRNLEKATAANKQILAVAKEAAKLIKDVAQRKDLLRVAKNEAFEGRAAIKEERGRQRGDARSAKVRQRARVGFAEAGGVEIGALASGDAAGILQGALKAAPGVAALIGPAAALVALVVPKIKAEVEAALEVFERNRVAPLVARLERQERELLSVRLREDERFRSNLLGEDVRQARVLQQGRHVLSADLSGFTE